LQLHCACIRIGRPKKAIDKTKVFIFVLIKLDIIV
jgi:hypothetical protein